MAIAGRAPNGPVQPGSGRAAPSRFPPKPHNMTLSQLRYVVAVDEHRHFTRAAEACGVAQPTLSMQIRKLEEELGVGLFHRDRFRVRPTDLGSQLVEQARTILREAERMREVAGTGIGTVAGQLRLGVIPTVGPLLLPRALPRLLELHPELSVVVEERKTSELVEALRAGRLDAALLATPTETTGLVQESLFREPFLAYLAPGHHLARSDSVTRNDLQLADLWLLREGHCFRDQVLDLCSREEVDPAPPRALSFESGNLHTLKRLVDEIGGMTLLPQLMLGELTPEEQKRVRPFADPPPARTVSFVHGRTYLKQAARAVLADTLRASVRGEGVLDASDHERSD
jgi:LysR family transcriptional regulator, hydrogen peroxide-inducible genes activator